MANETKIPLFRRFVIQNFPYIEQDFDALTDYQLISKIVEYLNKVIESQNGLVDDMNDLETAFNTLKDYVDHYFDNLDVQEEINNKLDAMAEAGTLQEIIAEYIQANTAWCFDSVADMKLADNFINGSYARTFGFYAKNDGGANLYKIRTITNDDVVDDITIIELADDTLIAELITTSSMNIVQFGGQNNTDVTARLGKMLNDSKIDTIDLMNMSFTLTSLITLKSNVTIKNATLTSTNLVKTFEGTNISNVKIENINFNGDNTSEKCMYLTTCNNIEITGCKFHDYEVFTGSSAGVDTHSCSFITIKDSEFYDIGNNSDTTSHTNYEPRGIILENTTNSLIENCYIHDIYTINEHGDGVQFLSPLDRTPSNNIIRDCKITDCIYRGIKIQQMGVEVNHCKIDNSTADKKLQQSAIAVYDSHIKVLNCEISQKADVLISIGVSNEITTVCDDVIIDNNILTFSESIVYGVITCTGNADMITNLIISNNIINITDVNKKPHGISIRDNFNKITIVNNQFKGGETCIDIRKKSGALSQDKHNLVIAGNNGATKQTFVLFDDDVELYDGSITGNNCYYDTPLSTTAGRNSVKTSDITLFKTFVIDNNNICCDDRTIKFNDGPTRYGLTTSRPSTAVRNGFLYFDTTLHMPIVFFNDKWYKPDGTEATS